MTNGKRPKEPAYTRQETFALTMLKLFVGLLIASTLLFSTWTTVQPGERGILITLGKIERVVDPGFTWKIPGIQTVKKMDVKTQLYSVGQEVPMEAASADLQDVYIKASFNYRVLPDKAFEVYQRVGMEYEPLIIAPIFEQSLKASTVNYEAEKLLENRNKLRTDIETELVKKLEMYGIEVEGVNIENIDFRPEFRIAIERKAVAAQNLLAQERELEITKIQAEQAAAVAKGEADALLLRAEADARRMILTAEAEAKALELKKMHTTREIIELEWIRAWNGVLPPFTFGDSDVMPLINIGSDVTEAIVPVDWEQ